MYRVVAKSWGFLSRKQKYTLLWVALARVVSNLIDVAAIATIGLVGAVALGSTIPQLDSILFLSRNQESRVLQLLAVTACLFLVKAALGLTLSRITFLYLAKIETAFSATIARDIFSHSVSHLKRQSKSETEWAVLRSTNIAFTVLLGQAIILVTEVSLTVLVFVFLLITDWASAILVTAYIMLTLALFNLFSRNVLERAGTRFSGGSVLVNQAISDFTAAFREIRAVSKTDEFLRPINAARSRVARANATNMFVSAIPRLMIELALVVGAIAFFGYQYSVYSGVENIVTFGVFLLGSLRMMSAVLPLQRSAMSVKYALPGAASAHDLLDAIFANTPSNLMGLQSTRGLDSNLSPRGEMAVRVVLDHVSFRYPDSTLSDASLEDLSLEMQPGSITAIFGPSGSGKTTLVDLILGLHEPTTGNVLLSGVEPSLALRQYPHLVGYVPQRPGMVRGSLAQNIALGVAAEKIELSRLRYAVEASALSDLVASLPDGYTTDLGSHADGFSGGQIQRIGLARALYVRPRLLILDEATSALDIETEAQIMREISALRGHTTVIMISHKISTVERADHVYVLERGRLSASGSPTEIKDRSSLMKRLLISSDQRY